MKECERESVQYTDETEEKCELITNFMKLVEGISHGEIEKVDLK